jgi:hypothetical protein
MVSYLPAHKRQERAMGCREMLPMRKYIRWFALVAIAFVLLLIVLANRQLPVTTQAVEPKSNSTAIKPPLLVGTASCSARSCHGALEPASGLGLRRDEYTVWLRDDKHAAAYRVLFGDRARQIAKNLAATSDRQIPAHEDSRCLACHGPPAAAERIELAELRLDGIGCEACHGAARDWLAPHTAPEQWSRLPAAAKQAQGMVPPRDLTAFAPACCGCHVGAAASANDVIPRRDVNHDLIASGHPRLNFEFTTYLANLPPHWNIAARKENRESGHLARLWALGQLASAQAALELVVHRANSPDAPWPEFAEYDCFSCHHHLSGSSGLHSSARSATVPVKPSWGSWYFAILPVLPNSTDAGISTLGTLKQKMQLWKPNRMEVMKLAKKLKDELMEWKSPLIESSAAQVLQPLRSRLSQAGAGLTLPNWDMAEQLVLAAHALEQARLATQQGVPTAQDQDIQAKIQSLLEKLAFKEGFDSPVAFEMDNKFAKQLTDLFALVGKVK